MTDNATPQPPEGRRFVNPLNEHFEDGDTLASINGKMYCTRAISRALPKPEPTRSTQMMLCPECNGNGVTPIYSGSGAKVGQRVCRLCEGRCEIPAPKPEPPDETARELLAARAKIKEMELAMGNGNYLTDTQKLELNAEHIALLDVEIAKSHARIAELEQELLRIDVKENTTEQYHQNMRGAVEKRLAQAESLVMILRMDLWNEHVTAAHSRYTGLPPHPLDRCAICKRTDEAQRWLLHEWPEPEVKP